MISEEASRRKDTKLRRAVRGSLRIECILVGISWFMLISYAGISNAQRVVASKEHLESEHRVEFRSGATPSDKFNFNRPHDQISGYLYKPKGEGRYPAVVLLHDDVGIHMIHIEWAKRLAAWGYVALVVDSRSRPGFTDSPITMAQDAYGALKHLHGLPFVDPERIAVMGWYDGANAILDALKATPKQLDSPSPMFTSEPNYRFKAGIIYHPRCSSIVTTMYSSLLIFVGGKDEYFPSGGCDSFPKENRAGGEPYRLIVYPGATIFFDYGETGQDAYHNRVEPDSAATKDSIKRIMEFLKEKL